MAGGHGGARKNSGRKKQKVEASSTLLNTTLSSWFGKKPVLPDIQVNDSENMRKTANLLVEMNATAEESEHNSKEMMMNESSFSDKSSQNNDIIETMEVNISLGLNSFELEF